MKKILFAAVAALAIVGCTQNEEFDNLGNKAEIKVGTVVKATTKAAVTDDTALQGTGFTVYAYNTGDKEMAAITADGLGTPFMDGVSATYGNNVWTLAGGPHYWPLNSKVQFFAYATDAAATKYEIAAGAIFPSLTYTIDADAAKQKDFVVAKLINQTKTNDAVKLAFTHALTQVNFSAKGKNDKLKYTITSIGIQGVANTGIYSFADGTWTASGVAGTYTYPTETDAVVQGADYKALDQKNGALMLMPQAMTENSKIKLSYKVYTVATVDGKVVETLIDEIKDALIDLDKSAAWGAGKKVRYNLTLSSEGATVGFTTEVGPWNTTDDTPVEK